MLNKSIIMGRLTNNPEVKSTQNGVAVTIFTLAVPRPKFGDKQETDFIPVVTWRKTAEFAGRYFSKGQLVYVCGRLQSRVWEDSEGKKRKVLELVADEIGFAESKKSDSNPTDEPMGYETNSANNDDDLPF